MILKFKKNDEGSLSEHFYSKDFDCKCNYPDCLETLIDEDLIEGLEELWTITKGFHIDSGFRCVKHNKEIGGVPDSQHLLGKAADCKSVYQYTGPLMAQYAEKIKVFRKGGIGIYPTFVHVDTRQDLARWGTPKTC